MSKTVPYVSLENGTYKTEPYSENKIHGDEDKIIYNKKLPAEKVPAFTLHGTGNTYAQEQLDYIDHKNETERNKNVDHPSYYTKGGIEAIDVIEAWNLGFCLGNTVKYISRCGRKSNKIVEDLEKARWYLDREIKTLKSQLPTA